MNPTIYSESLKKVINEMQDKMPDMTSEQVTAYIKEMKSTSRLNFIQEIINSLSDYERKKLLSALNVWQ